MTEQYGVDAVESEMQLFERDHPPLLGLEFINDVKGNYPRLALFAVLIISRRREWL